MSHPLLLIAVLGLQAPAVHFPDTLGYVQSLQHGANFAPLPSTALSALQEAATALWAGDGAGAQELAEASGYWVYALQTDTEWLWVLLPGEATPPGHAVLVVRDCPERDLLIEAPHVPDDAATGEEAAMLFDRVRARGLLIAGAQRCASYEPAACGTSGVACQLAQAPESDVAHAVRNGFFAMHSGIVAGDEQAAVLQLHANHQPTTNGQALLSNGTRAAASDGAMINRLAQALQDAGITGARTCNLARTPQSEAALCGSGNVQGHAAHGAANACSPDGPAANERFVHMEQNSGYLAADLAGWTERVAQAVEKIF